jgi:predicted nucleic acid-binding protein
VVVVSNTTPLNYLILIDAENVLLHLFTRVLVPPAVIAELSRPATPQRVRRWIASRPAWLEVTGGLTTADPALLNLDEGEREAIGVAEALDADLLLMDERDGVRVARKRGLTVVGTLGILDRAAEQRLIELPVAIARLQQTTFRAAPQLMAALIQRDAKRRA